MEFKIPVFAEYLRSIKDPNNDKIRIVHSLINVNDLPGNIPIDPDPRRPRMTGQVPKRIVESLKSDDGKFHLKNRGITISARHCEFDNRHNLLTLEIPKDDEYYGILDGAHTYESIVKTLEDLRKKAAVSNPDQQENTDDRVLNNQYVHVEILERIENDLSDISEARNFSISLKAWTLANYRDKFDWLLETLGMDFSARVIKVSEGDEQPVGILDIIQILSAANPILFEKEKPANEAYNKVGKMLESFIAEDDKFGFQKMAPVCRDILRLHDYVRLHFKSAYNAPDKSGRRGAFGARKDAKEAKDKPRAKSKATYYFLDPIGKPVIGDAVIDKGLSIPLISSFRVLLEQKKNGHFRWVTDPFKFFDKYGTELVRTLMDASDNYGGNLQNVGRDAQVYRQLTSEARRWYLEDRYEADNSA
jgi:AIPR protein